MPPHDHHPSQETGAYQTKKYFGHVHSSFFLLCTGSKLDRDSVSSQRTHRWAPLHTRGMTSAHLRFKYQGTKSVIGCSKIVLRLGREKKLDTLVRMT